MKEASGDPHDILSKKFLSVHIGSTNRVIPLHLYPKLDGSYYRIIKSAWLNDSWKEYLTSEN